MVTFTFTSREWDKDTGLYYYRARFYDPMEGRFIQKDPISFAGGDVNLYGYVQNNPGNRTDPSGLASYDGIFNLISGGYIGGGAVLWGAVSTKCVGGKKQQGIVTAFFAGVDFRFI